MVGLTWASDTLALGYWYTLASACLPRACPNLWRQVVEEGGHSFPVLDPQDFSGHAETRYGGEWCIFLSLAPQELSGSAIEEGVHNNPGLTLQALPHPLEAKLGRGLSIFPSLTSQGLSCPGKVSHQ